MSRNSPRQFRERQAIGACRRGLKQLRQEIAAGPYRVIDSLFELVTCLLEHTGGTRVTEELRTELAECHRLWCVRKAADGRKQLRARLRVINSSGGQC